MIESGPYFDAFKDRDIEILFIYDLMDDFALSSLGEFDGKKILTADSADIDLSQFDEIKAEGAAPQEEPLEKKSVDELCGWLKKALEKKVEEVVSQNA